MIDRIRFIFIWFKKRKHLHKGRWVPKWERPFLRQYILFYEALQEVYKTVKEDRIVVDHSNGDCYYKDKNYGLIYPRKWIDYIKKEKEGQNKDIRFFFSGYQDPIEPNLRNWIFEYEGEDSMISFSPKGRLIPRNRFDKDFFICMCRAQFALCPQGYPYKWTYRFFEATLCKAIPIVSLDDIIPEYEGFKYFIHGQDLSSYEYSEEIAEYNYNLALERLFLPQVEKKK